jgi:hypothetical protein
VAAVLFLCGASAEDLASANLQVERFRAAIDAQNGPVTVVSFGDSMADSPDSIQLRLFERLRGQFGCAGYSFRNCQQTRLPQCERGTIDSGVTTNWWMQHFLVPPGGVLWWANLWDWTGSSPSDLLAVYWLARPEGGAFSVHLSTNGGPWSSPIAALDGASDVPQVRFTNFFVGRQNYRLRLEGLTGTNLVLGGTQLDRSSNGVHIVFLAEPGINLNEIIPWREHVKTVLRGLDPQLVIWHMKELADIGATNLTARLSDLNELWPEAVPHGDVVYTGTSLEQRDSTNAWTLQQNRIVRAAAIGSGYGYVDCMKPCGSYETMMANKYFADEVHLTSAGNLFLADVVWQDMGFFALRSNRKLFFVPRLNKLEWLASPGVVYDVEGSTDLRHWTAIDSVSGAGKVHQTSLPADSSARFFRLRLK